MEKYLVQLYAIYVDTPIDLDSVDEFIDYNIKQHYPDVISHVKQNFPNLGWYHVILNLEELHKDGEVGLGDAVDDLSDII